jgi:hypothetical protein
MKADLREELDLLNKNVDEIIRLFQRTTDAGIWTQKEATRHAVRLESIRKKLNADYREIMAMHERSRKESTPVKPGS